MSILFIVNDSQNSISGRRVRNLIKYFTKFSDCEVLYRDNNAKIRSIFSFLHKIIASRPRIIYLEQIAYSGCIAILLARLFVRFKFIFCVSDAYAELAKSNHNKILAFLASLLEKFSLGQADLLLTCSPLHASWLKEKFKGKAIDFIEHGVDIEIFKPMTQIKLRSGLGFSDSLVLGLVGSLAWSKRYNFCYGWDVIEALRLLKDLNIKALIVGGGSGLDQLKEKAKLYGIEEKVVFTDKIPYQSIPNYINCFDVCISTQSNDLVGLLRCPTKLSEYMACGKYIISTDVGYATLYVNRVGKLLPYYGVKDNTYPKRLSEHLRYVYYNREELEKGKEGINIAKECLNNKVLSQKLEKILSNISK